MKKVCIIHGFGGTPNGGWRSWLMTELDKEDVYAVSLPMPDPETPRCSEWVKEIDRYVEMNKEDEIYLVGHSLGATTILRYLESTESTTILPTIILVSGPCESLNREELENFLDRPFDFQTIKSKAKGFVIIHGDNDDRVPLSHGEKLSKELDSELIVIKNGGHLNGRSGWKTLPQCLEVLHKIL